VACRWRMPQLRFHEDTLKRAGRLGGSRMAFPSSNERLKGITALKTEGRLNGG